MKMRITHISDTHNKHNQLNGKLPGGDLLIHSGDFTSIGRKHEVEEFIKWFNQIEGYTNKVFIAGNHDLLENNKDRLDSITPMVKLLPDLDIRYYAGESNCYLDNNDQLVFD